MTCTCPKCKAAFEYDVAAMPAEDTFDKCPNCKTNLSFRKESFAYRALYSSTEIACAECGSNPGTSIFCEDCHALYPDILVIEPSSVAKKLSKILASSNQPKHSKSSAAATSHQESFRAASSGKGKGVKVGSPLQLAFIVVLILAAVAAGCFFWYQNKVATEYSEQYVRALFGMKSARDFEIKASSGLVNTWKAGGASTFTEKDLKFITAAPGDVDTLMKRIGKVPDKFTASHEALTKLNNNFKQLHAAVIATAGAADIYAVTVQKMDDEFMRNARTLKSGLPPGKLAEKFEKSRKEYKALQEL